MELTTLDTELLRLHQTLGELINLGLVEEIFFPEEEGNGPISIGPTTRYRLVPPAGRWMTKKEKQEESEAPARAHAVGA